MGRGLWSSRKVTVNCVLLCYAIYHCTHHFESKKRTEFSSRKGANVFCCVFVFDKSFNLQLHYAKIRGARPEFQGNLKQTEVTGVVSVCYMISKFSRLLPTMHRIRKTKRSFKKLNKVLQEVPLRYDLSTGNQSVI